MRMVRATAVLNGGADPLQSAEKIHAAVGPEIAAMLNKAMALKPEERYASASDFREALCRMGRTGKPNLPASELRSAAVEPVNRCSSTNCSYQGID